MPRKNLRKRHFLLRVPLQSLKPVLPLRPQHLTLIRIPLHPRRPGIDHTLGHLNAAPEPLLVHLGRPSPMIAPDLLHERRQLAVRERLDAVRAVELDRLVRDDEVGQIAVLAQLPRAARRARGHADLDQVRARGRVEDVDVSGDAFASEPFSQLGAEAELEPADLVE